jgi:hypothetical protein
MNQSILVTKTLLILLLRLSHKLIIISKLILLLWHYLWISIQIFIDNIIIIIINEYRFL